MILEDGSGVEGANSYVSEDTFTTYCDDRGITPADGDIEPALVRATTAIDAMYGSRFPGSKTNGRDQALLWPRTGATDADGEEIADDEIPVEIMNAVFEAAVRELTSPGSMQPDLERGGSIKRLKAGSVEVEYGANAIAGTAYTIIDGILAGLLGAPASPYSARAVRA